ncbi:hypothetical protein FE784_39695 [Paenibacillus hemerocallicola]|uniref:Uncharacterized protein n=1 Tax=Paenibacillus hemerocallicola TaxID=1172614 RepID=A0A5C4SVV7_9BACL|nr:hypothetical protein [Paenibacillus hemerocallicola]TNJ54947.1 hypothetical protein FE784_39695 [Paenibacillus hemerocallicola]
MILYRLAKWMEERKRLKQLIAETDENPAVYIEQKALVEQQMIREAYQWLEPGKAAEEAQFALHVTDELGGVQPLYGMEDSDRLPALILKDVLANMQRNAVVSGAHAFASGAVKLTKAEETFPEELYHMPLVGEEAVHVQP